MNNLYIPQYFILRFIPLISISRCSSCGISGAKGYDETASDRFTGSEEIFNPIARYPGSVIVAQIQEDVHKRYIRMNGIMIIKFPDKSLHMVSNCRRL